MFKWISAETFASYSNHRVTVNSIEPLVEPENREINIFSYVTCGFNPWCLDRLPNSSSELTISVVRKRTLAKHNSHNHGILWSSSGKGMVEEHAVAEPNFRSA